MYVGHRYHTSSCPARQIEDDRWAQWNLDEIMRREIFNPFLAGGRGSLLNLRAHLPHDCFISFPLSSVARLLLNPSSNSSTNGKERAGNKKRLEPVANNTLRTVGGLLFDPLILIASAIFLLLLQSNSCSWHNSCCGSLQQLWRERKLQGIWNQWKTTPHKFAPINNLIHRNSDIKKSSNKKREVCSPIQ